MVAEISLPDDSYAYYDGHKWVCGDDRIQPVLDYFTEKAIEKMAGHEYPNRLAQIAIEVTKMITGAEFIRADRSEDEWG